MQIHSGQYKWKYNYSNQFLFSHRKRSVQMQCTRSSSGNILNPQANVSYIENIPSGRNFCFILF